VEEADDGGAVVIIIIIITGARGRGNLNHYLGR